MILVDPKSAYLLNIHLQDGKLGGLVRPNDGECHLNETGFYTHSTLQDYPSISFVNYLAKQNSVSVIWAVTQVLSDFEYTVDFTWIFEKLFSFASFFSTTRLFLYESSSQVKILGFILGKDWSVQTVDQYGGGVDGRRDL